MTDGRTTLRERDIALFEFASGKIGLYDFSGEQYHSFIRSRHIIVRGRDGELSDRCFTGWMTDIIRGLRFCCGA